ncbi:unnamed protein product [Kluyveromyces dobzhanskii CBS 2104]|uniref:WGS project CCBQ000000000 data, contig 00012 n=1 Tax=Kluyveromyces dobzhanskii CBS 2104 TaxID=1427455 RepID=A0A0A8L315_9SACH|nr:unnamed protein product [Kluyveromyces dobzhanskii CBS 2104]
MQHLTPVDKTESASCLIDEFKSHEKPSHNASLNASVATLLSALTSNFSNQRINNSKQLILHFINEVVKRSKTSQHVIIQATYLFDQIYSKKLKPVSITNMPEFARCSKRVFLSCLILAHKFNNDSTFSMKTWCLISGLKARDLASMERWTLSTLDYRLRIENSVLNKWYATFLLESFIANPLLSSSSSCMKRARSEFEEDSSYTPSPHKLHKWEVPATR